MNSSEAIGRRGRPMAAFTVAIRSQTRATAWAWPITRAANQSRVRDRSSGIRSLSSISGRPVSRANEASTS